MWSNTLWTRAWTLKRDAQEIYWLESLSNMTSTRDFTLGIAKVGWNLGWTAIEGDEKGRGEQKKVKRGGKNGS